MMESYADFINSIIVLFTRDPCKRCIVRPMCTQRCDAKILPLPGGLSKFIAFSNVLANLILIAMAMLFIYSIYLGIIS
jgi:hypothetical protein